MSRDHGTARHIDASSLDKWQPFRGPFTRWPRLSDAALAIVSFGLTIVILRGDRGDDVSLSFIAFALFLLGNAALYWRRRYPEHVHIAVLAASALSMLLGYLGSPIFALVFSLYSLGRYSDDDRKSVIGLVAALALLVISEIALSGFTSEDLFDLLVPLAVWYAGRRVRARGEYLRLSEERAVATERTRIARELHDIVAHQVSLMTVQAGAAKTIVDTDPDAAARAMGAVEVAGRQALDELRHLLGVLRPGRGGSELGPQPGRADLPRLVEEIERAGLGVSLSLDDGYRRLPARIELAVYRIVQEALTNVLKHAGPDAHAEVSVRAGERDVTVRIEDTGLGATRLPGSGHGIAGMRERAELLGGTLTAGPRDDGGFAVVATLPASEEVT